MRSVKLSFYVVGAVFELAGIISVASPDLVPGAVRFGAWLRGHLRLAVDRIRRFIGGPRHQVIELGVAEAISTAGGVTPMKSMNPEATLEEKVAFMLQRDQEAQGQVNALAKGMSEIEQEGPRRLDALRSQMEAHVERELRATQADFRAARVLGAVALAIGLALTTAANFIT